MLPSIRVPTLVLHRGGDRGIPVDHARYLAEHIRGAKYVELPGDDHLLWVGDTETILGEIEEFLTGVRPAPEIDRVLLTPSQAVTDRDSGRGAARGRAT